MEKAEQMHRYADQTQHNAVEHRVYLSVSLSSGALSRKRLNLLGVVNPFTSVCF